MDSKTYFWTVKKVPYQYLSLTALWAFVEAGLGGFLHALHLPFTGIVLGGFAVIIISIIGQTNATPFRKIIEATLIVLAIKIIANPATSPFAYIAVGFQGLLGAIIYSLPKIGFAHHLTFAIGSMLESAGQKLLIMTLFLGNTFWEGLDGLGKSITKIFGTSTDMPFSNVIIISYLALFAAWGIVLATWMLYIKQMIAERMNLYNDVQAQTISVAQTSKNKISTGKMIMWVLIILAIISVFIKPQSGIINGIIYLIRTISILFIWQQLILPIWQKQITKWGTKYANKNTNYSTVQQHIPNIASMVKPLYNRVSSTYSGIKKWKEFMLALIVTALQASK